MVKQESGVPGEYQGPDVPEESPDGAARQASASAETTSPRRAWPAGKEGGSSTSVTDVDSQLTAARHLGHGGVGNWLAHNFEADDSYPALPSKTVRKRTAPSGDAETHHGNLLQLPGGALFGTTRPPSPEETEELLRYAAAAQGEMQQDADMRRRRPNATGGAGDDAGQGSTGST